jgi:hypothetical protein
MSSLPLAPNFHAFIVLPLVLFLPILYFYYLHFSFLYLHYQHISLLYIGDNVAISTSIDKELCISILKEVLQHLEKLPKTQLKNVELVIIGGVLALKFQAEV